MMLPRVNVLGVGISAINMKIALSVVEGWITRREQQYICLATVNGIIECQRDPALIEVFNNSGLTTPDGMPLVWLSRLHGFAHVGRVYGPDLMEALCELSCQKGYRHYLYGGAEGVAEALKSRLRNRFPGLKVVGTYTPPFRPLTPDEDAEVVRSINEAEPDIVWVGLGSPKQDHWMAAHVGRIAAPVLIGVGAAFDFHAGRKKQAPRWMQRSGLEWLFRLSQEPGRLWWRYLVYNPLFVTLVSLQLAHLKRYAHPQKRAMLSR
ncbi:MAG: WecB/TagA/CpsF family glycosyltransferase [Chloroflexi bacterium]|nr:WecB/TagA/CpsF family glycosyltransferase [Chloroflexota bacterium]